ncbi:MAG: ankyrin repeat domain-containing protein [Endomicrobia bacterium]|nr:ankyrin repeat domain-containing protein [Endomicrobiia bacterium]
MFEAVKNSDVDTVSNLIKTGIDPNIQGYLSRTALMLASMSRHKEIVEALLKANADPNIEDKNGNTALIFAASYSTKGHEEIVKILKKAGAK